MFKSSAVIFSLVASAMATVFVTSPTATTTCTGGQPCNINWRDDGVAPSLEDFGLARVSVYTGNARQQTLLQPITDSVNVATTASIVFNPDPSIGPSGSDYFIRFESLSLRDAADATLPALAFSARFAIAGMAGQFNSSVQDQIDGLSTAPLAGPTSTGTRTTTSRLTTTSTTSSRPTGSSTTTAGAAGETNAASHVMIGGATAGFAGVVAAVMGLVL